MKAMNDAGTLPERLTESVNDEIFEITVSSVVWSRNWSQFMSSLRSLKSRL